jgi:hypothetical protein
MGLGVTIWGQAVLADKYAFSALLAAWIVGLALWWDRDYDQPGGDRLLYALSLAFGLGLLHHRSLGLYAPVLGLLVIWNLKRGLWRDPRRTAICGALVLLPALLIYPTVLPWLRSRELSPLLWQPTSSGDWIDFLLERHVLTNEALVFDDLGSIQSQLGIYWDTILADYTLLVPLVGILGLVYALRKRPSGGLFLLISFGLLAMLGANFRGNDRQFTYYIPSFVTLGYGFALGLVALRDGLATWMQRRLVSGLRSQTGAVLVVLLALMLPAVQLIRAYPDQRKAAVYGEPLDLWRETLKTGDMGARLSRGMVDLPADAVLASDWEQVTILWYEQQVEGVRPDLTILYPIERYADFAGSARPVCLARHLPVGMSLWHPGNVGALICLNWEPVRDLPDDVQPLEIVLNDPLGQPLLELAAVDAAEPVYAAGTHAPLLLYWRALAEMPHDYSISLRVLDESWNEVWKRDIQNPVMGMYPTSFWQPGEVVADYHEMSLDRELPPGRYLWALVVYRPLDDGGFEQLTDSDGNMQILGGTFALRPG